MTVKKLIKSLKNYPGDADVYLYVSLGESGGLLKGTRVDSYKPAVVIELYTGDNHE